MRRIYTILLGVAVLGGAVYVYLHRQDWGLAGSSSGSSGSDQASHPAQVSWTMVDRSPEGFKLEMPAETREIEVPAYNQQGGAEQVAMIYSYPDPATSYSISWADNPPVARSVSDDPKQTLDTARNGALARTQTQLVSEAQSTRQGFPIRDFVGRNQSGGVFNARLVLADHRLYLLMAAFQGAGSRRDDDVTRFFDSFRVVSAAAAQ